MKLSALRVPVILGVATACSGENDPGEFRSPSVALTFPPPVSSTDAESITVRGTASDPSGVAEVRVNGVLASTSDGFATWQADVPLANGMNTLAVAASDSRGNTDVRAAEARIESQPLLLRPSAIAMDPTSPLAFVLDSGPSLKSVDLMSGARAIVSDALHGSGPSLSGGRGIVLDGGRALVASGVNTGIVTSSVIAVDLVSGDRTVLSDDSHGMGPSFDLLFAITVDAGRALVTSHRPMGVGASGAVVAVDLVSGDRTILSDPTVGSGPALRYPEAIVVDGGRALVLDGSLNALVAVDLASGNRTIVSDASTGTGPLFSPYQQAITLDGDRALVLDGGLDAIFAVDLVSGDRTFLATPPGEPRIPGLIAIALDVTDGTRALVTDVGHGAVVGVDLASGERTFVSPPTSVGAGPSIEPTASALEEGRALVVDEDASSLVAVDLSSGDRTVVSDPSNGSGPRFFGPRAVAVDGARALVLAYDTEPQHDMAVFAVDLASGDRSILSGPSRGAGLLFGEEAWDIALAGSRALVTNHGGILAVDLESGDRTIVSGGSTGLGPRWLDDGLRGIVLDGNRALVVDNSDTSGRVVAVDLASGDRSVLSSDEFKGEGQGINNAKDLVLDGDRVLVVRDPGASIHAVDLATGDRSLLSDFSSGAGPNLSDPSGIARWGDRVYVTDSGLRAIVALDPRTGQRVIVAR